MTSILSEEQKTAILGVIPMKRMGTASDIANITTFLASDKSDYILDKFLLLTVVW